MRKLLAALSVLILFASGCKDKPADTELAANKIYLFYSNSCPHCHDALEYINQKYPNLKISMVNVANTEGRELLFRCAQKFKLGRTIGTPLFCMGDNHIMGWSTEKQNQFDQLVKPFLH